MFATVLSMIHAVDRAVEAFLERDYRNLVRRAATGEKVEPTAEQLDSVSRFPSDFSRDVSTLRARREADAQRRAAEAELAGLEPPAARPTATTPVADYPTIGALASALGQYRGGAGITTKSEIDRQATRRSHGDALAHAVGVLRRTADRTIGAELSPIHDSIGTCRERIAERVDLWRLRELARAAMEKPETDQASKLAIAEAAAEYKRLGRKVPSLESIAQQDAADRAEIARLKQQIDRIAEKQLDPESLQWSSPRA